MFLKCVNLTPTMKCNLKCELCGVRVPHYDYRPQMNEIEFSKTLKELFNLVDGVGRLQITGGEPLIHPKLDVMLQECFKYNDKFEEMWFFSNCAVPFRENVLQVLSQYKDKVVIHCSDYGVKPEISKTNLEMLGKYEITYKYLKYFGDDQYYGGWVDQGDFVAHNRTEAENEKIFSECPHATKGGSWYIRNGQMHWCGRSIRGTELNKIPLLKKDYLDLFDETTTIEEKRLQLEQLLEVKTITACDYCNGNYGTEDVSKRRPAGKQL